MEFPKLSNDFIINRLKFPSGKIPCVIDTDTYNEVDDQFAVAWAMRSPERLDVKAVYAAPYSHSLDPEVPGALAFMEGAKIMPSYEPSPEKGMMNSYNEILNLFNLMGIKPDEFVFKGSTSYIGKTGKPVESDAARDLVKKAMAQPDDEPLYVIAIGAITNVVSAMLMEPEIIKKIVVVWLGGQPIHFDSSYEFNLVQDIPAVQILFNSGVPLVYVPCMTVASLLTISAEELEANLKGKSKVGTYLTDIVTSQIGGSAEAGDAQAAFFRFAYLQGEDDQDPAVLSQFHSNAVAWTRIIWDISTVGYVINPNWALTTIEPAPILGDDTKWIRTNEDRHPIRVCNYVFRDLIYGDMFLKLGHD